MICLLTYSVDLSVKPWWLGDISVRLFWPVQNICAIILFKYFILNKTLFVALFFTSKNYQLTMFSLKLKISGGRFGPYGTLWILIIWVWWLIYFLKKLSKITRLFFLKEKWHPKNQLKWLMSFAITVDTI